MAEKKEEKKPAPKPEKAGDDYELLPHKELQELRDELNKLKQQPTEKTLQISMVELASKLDRMMEIFEEAQEMIRVEEGALTFQEKMRPLMERMEKVLQQNSQIAEGIVGLHDLIMDMRDEVAAGARVKEEPKEEKLEPIESLDTKLNLPEPKEKPKEKPKEAPPPGPPPGPPPAAPTAPLPPPGPPPGAGPIPPAPPMK
ncbi:MAG: hypothetical protein ACE5FT_03120 [Candidatus Nanoarchaeia archaeon]